MSFIAPCSNKATGRVTRQGPDPMKGWEAHEVPTGHSGEIWLAEAVQPNINRISKPVRICSAFKSQDHLEFLCTLPVLSQDGLN